ncbi:MAG: hypothetical protein AABY32_02225 [Nanoarchaeota archaeon]
MLEVAISLRRDLEGEGEIGKLEKQEKKCGDILVAKIAPANWGEEEKRLFLITYLDDPELELKVKENGGLISYPYAVDGASLELPGTINGDLLKDDPKDEPSTHVMINRSKYRVKVGQEINKEKQPNMFISSNGLDCKNITEEISEPTTKLNNISYCPICNEKQESRDGFCPKCNNSSAQYLELSDLFFDDSARI